VLVIAAVLILVIVRNAGQQVDQPTTAGTTAPAEEDKSEPTPDPTLEDNEEPVAVPTPDTTGRDFDHIFREINEFRNWLYRNPNPELLTLIYHPECECYQSARQTLEQLVERGLRFNHAGFEVESIEVAEEFESAARLRVAVERIEHQLLDDDGEIVNTVDDAGRAEFSFSLVREGARWRVRTVTQLSDD
jgi:hypothetical protein